jgi:hypothetical protein
MFQSVVQSFNQVNQGSDNYKVQTITIFPSMTSKILPKVKVGATALLREQLEVDTVDYQYKSLGCLCNQILVNFECCPPPTPGCERFEVHKAVQPISFVLHQGNARFYQSALKARLPLAVQCRYYFDHYINLPRARREMLLKSAVVHEFERAIHAHATASFTYRGKRFEETPCFFGFSKMMHRAYLVTYSHSGGGAGKFHALRVCHLEAALAGKKGSAAYEGDAQILREMREQKEHFGPFLAHGQEVRARLTPAGRALLLKATPNRPNWDERRVKNGEYVFECTERQAQIYFGQFFDDAEILEPASLREWFANKFSAASKIYT